MTDLQSRIAALSPQQRALLESRVADLAPARNRSADKEGIQPRDRDRPTPLSFAQQREWALERFRPSNNIPAALRLVGEIDLELLGRSLTEVMARHEALRTTVEMVDRTPVAVVRPVTPIPVPMVDLSDLDPEAQRVEIRRRFDAEVMRPFPPDRPQRMRVTVLRLAPHEHVAVLTTHHSSSDGWSMSIIAREAVAVYRALQQATVANLPLPPIQYGDFAVWQRQRLGEERVAAELEHWRKVLADVPPRLALPTDRPHPVRRTFAGTCYPARLSGPASSALHAFAEQENVSTSVIMLAACSALLYKYTAQDDLVFGSAVSGRTRTEMEHVVGCFANVLPLRMRVSRTHTLMDALRQAREVVSEAFDHQDIPFDRLIEELAPQETSQTPLIQMMINVPTAPKEVMRSFEQSLELPGLRVTPEVIDPGPLPIDLILIVSARPDAAVRVDWHYSTELFDAGTIVRLAGQLEYVLDRLVNSPDRRIGDLQLPDTTTPAPAPSQAAAAPVRAIEGTVELFQRQVDLAPDAPAVICDGVATSFDELNRDANRFAARLRGLGVGPETTVGILLERSPRLAVAILGVLKAGGAYVPLDPQYPADRIAYLLSDARASVLITTDKLAPLASGASAARLVVDDPEALPDGADANLPDPPPASAPAYVCYTSGSTGTPKGVVIEHRSLVTFAREAAERLRLGAGDRFLQLASPGFDVLAEELFPIWLVGGAVVIPPAKQTGPGVDLVALSERERVSVMELPAAYWHEWARELDRTERELPGSLRLVIVGSERVLPERLAMWQKHGVPLLNVYGITETTVSSTFFRLGRNASPADLRHLPIGTPLPSVDLAILDSALQPVPTGGVGELYIGGISLARGYLRRPGLTAERFVADPDPAHPGRRIYRTGDLVRQRADGNLEFLSRADAQIKIRGFRVEPAEIESAMCRHPQVAQAVVTVREPAPGDRRLVAYLVPEPRTRPSMTDLRRFLSRELPPYLVPAAFVQLDTLPLTTNGKVDHDRLPEPGDERPVLDEELVLPQSPVERQLADLIAAVLGVTVVGAQDNFFELGGDSILAIQVAAKAQEAGIGLSPFDLFENPTVAQLAQVATEPEPAAGAQLAAEAGPEPQAKPDAEAAPTPEDYPLARIDQGQLDALLGSMATEPEAG